MTGGASSLRVLLIEDNKGDARLVREAMAESGRTVMHISHRESVAAGVDALGSDLFDAVLLDLSLPDSQGLETIRRIREVSEIPIVVMTSLDDEQVALRAVGEGAQDYLIKGPDTNARIMQRALRHAIERRHAQDQLAEASSYTAMGRLAGAVAHEFNTLLTTILGCSALLLEQIGDDPALRDLATTLQNAALRAAAVTEQVLAVGGAKQLQMHELSLNRVVADAGPMLDRIVGTRPVSITLDAEFDTVRFDAREAEHLLAVLALTAREAMPADGTLTVTTTNEVLTDVAARRKGLQSGLHVILTVHAGAAGLPPQAMAAILEPSARPASSTGQITGLSLAGVQGSLRAAGARIVAKSHNGTGITFTTRFPHRSQKGQT